MYRIGGKVLSGSGRGTGKATMRDRYAKRRRRNIIRQVSQAVNGSQAAQGPDPKLAELDGRVAELSEENKQLRESVVRQRAEFDNFRKRSQKEKEQIRDAS